MEYKTFLQDFINLRRLEISGDSAHQNWDELARYYGVPAPSRDYIDSLMEAL